MGDDDATVLDRVRQKGREAQARFRQRSKAHVVHLEQRIEQAQAKIKQRQKHYRDLQNQQRSLVLGALELGNKMMDVGTQAVRAAKHSDMSARTPTQELNMDNRVRLAKKFTMFDTPIIPPRPLRSFQHFASISYTDLHEVLKEIRPDASEGASVSNRTDLAASQPSTDAGLPPLRGPNSTARSRMSHLGTVPIDTVSNNVTLRGLVLEHLHRTAASMSVPESDVCYFVDTGRAISPTLTLTYSSSLSSKECAASVLLNYVVVAFEHALQVQFEEALVADDSPGKSRTQPVSPPISTKYHEAFSCLNVALDTPPCITAMRCDAKSTSSGLSDRTNHEFVREGHMSVASAYEQLVSKGYQGLKAALGEDAPQQNRSQGPDAQHQRPGGEPHPTAFHRTPCVRSGHPLHPATFTSTAPMVGQGPPRETATGQASKADASAANMHDELSHLSYRHQNRKQRIPSDHSDMQNVMRPGSAAMAGGGGGGALNSCAPNVASMNLDAQDSSQARERSRTVPAACMTGVVGAKQAGRQGRPEGVALGGTLADLMGLLHEDSKDGGSDGSFQAPYGQGGGGGVGAGVAGVAGGAGRAFMAGLQPPKGPLKQAGASWSGQSSGMGTAGEDVAQCEGSFSSDFMPGHHIENPLLRPNKDTGCTAGGSQENRNSNPHPPEGRLPQSWTRSENHSAWQAPDQDEYLEEFLQNMLSSFSAIGEGLEKQPVPPQPDNLTRKDCDSLRKISLSGTLEWVVACIMMHHHSKLLVCKVCLDTVSPFINCFEVDNMHARLFRSLNFSHIQKSNMARVWREWQRRKRCLDKQQATAVSTLNFTVKTPPIPPTEYSMINAIANSLLPLSVVQEMHHPQSQGHIMPPHSASHRLRASNTVGPPTPHPHVYAHAQPSPNAMQHQAFSMDQHGAAVMPLPSGSTTMLFTAGSSQILNHPHNPLDPLSVNMDPLQQQQQPFAAFGGAPAMPLMTTSHVPPTTHASISGRHRQPRRSHYGPPAASAATTFAGRHGHGVTMMQSMAGPGQGWELGDGGGGLMHSPARMGGVRVGGHAQPGLSGGKAVSTSTAIHGSGLSSMGMHMPHGALQGMDEVSSSKSLWRGSYSKEGGDEQSGRRSWHGSPFSSPPGTLTFSVGSEGLSQHASRAGAPKKHEGRASNFDAAVDTAWPALAGQCAYTTTSLCKALEDLRQVTTSDGRLYEDFIELRLHPSEIMDARQLMTIYSEHLKYTCPPADTMVLCEIASLQLRREEVFQGIEALAL